MWEDSARSFAAPSVDFRFYLYFEFYVDGPFKETKEQENNENQQLNLVRKILKLPGG